MSAETSLIFVDGENLVLRYQEMVAAGRIPLPDTIHIKDCFVWNQRVLNDSIWNLKRVSYYTSAIGDDQYVREVRSKISETTFKCNTGHVGSGAGVHLTTRTGQIVPFVRKKSARSRKESICDIAIAVDVMRTCYRDHVTTIWLFSGDGDFSLLLSEVIHSGKSVYVSAFSSGLSDEIPFSVDEFILLDKFFFEPLPPDQENSSSPPTPGDTDALSVNPDLAQKAREAGYLKR